MNVTSLSDHRSCLHSFRNCRHHIRHRSHHCSPTRTHTQHHIKVDASPHLASLQLAGYEFQCILCFAVKVCDFVNVTGGKTDKKKSCLTEIIDWSLKGNKPDKWRLIDSLNMPDHIYWKILKKQVQGQTWSISLKMAEQHKTKLRVLNLYTVDALPSVFPSTKWVW